MGTREKDVRKIENPISSNKRKGEGERDTKGGEREREGQRDWRRENVRKMKDEMENSPIQYI